MPLQTARTTRSKGGETVSSPAPQGATRSLWPIVLVLSTLLTLALLVAGYFYYQYRHTAKVADAKEIERLTQEIGRMLLLPENETPTLATVTDKEKLATQAFFQRAENGDKVLIYSQSGRAILYRPEAKKIIDVTTVNVKAPEKGAETEAPTEVTVPSIVRVALLNGSPIVGITTTKEKELTAQYPHLAIVSKETAKKTDYQTTLVVDLTGKNAESAQALAGSLGGTVAALPEGEAAPSDADLLIIFGQS